jgi:opacity protein-like surface antigen
MNPMRHALVVAFAGATALNATASLAADLAPPPPPVVEYSGWYLRGDIGVTSQQVDKLNNALYSSFSSVQNVDKGFDSAPLFGLGIGFQWNTWFRTDFTGEYRAKANFHGLDIGRAPGLILPDDYHASKSEWLFLANAYVDLGTWWNITPFIGAGVGTSLNTISSFRDVGITGIAPGGPILSVAYGHSASKWDFAWAVHAGFAYRVTPSVTLEFAYRYVDLGSARSGDLIGFDGTNRVNNPMEFKNLTSNDFKFGVRWAFDSGYGAPPVYVPPEPNYSPPLERRG